MITLIISWQLRLFCCELLQSTVDGDADYVFGVEQKQKKNKNKIENLSIVVRLCQPFSRFVFRPLPLCARDQTSDTSSLKGQLS